MRLQALSLLALVLLAGPACAAPKSAEVPASSNSFASTARGVGKGGALKVTGYRLEGDSADSTLELQQFEVWQPGTQVVLQGKNGKTTRAPPNTVRFRGKISGDATSVAFLSVRSTGEVSGMAFRGKSAWALGKAKGQTGKVGSKKADPTATSKKAFECGQEKLANKGRPLWANGTQPAAARKLQQTVLDSPYVANIAIETDYEFFALFGNADAAIDYVGDLIGYADVVYSREIQTDMTIGYLRLWPDGAATDPYPSVTDSGTALNNFRNYWNANMQSVERTIAHMLSGMNAGGGVAWVGVLCSWYSSPSGGYGYGWSGSLGGTFNWNELQTSNPQTVVWDIMVVIHEIGHNFNSPHSHDYCNIGGDSRPVDSCYSGCQSGATLALPSCSSPTPHFNGGAGGYNNMAMTFGVGHTCGISPSRIATRMLQHVQSQAAAYPRCFASRSANPPPPPPPSPSPRPPSPPPSPPNPPSPSPSPPPPSPNPPSPRPPSPNPPPPRPPSPNPPPPRPPSPNPPPPRPPSPPPPVCKGRNIACSLNSECCSGRCKKSGRFLYCQ